MLFYIALATGAILLYLYLSVDSSELRSIPGPKGWPVFGNFFQFQRRPAHLVIHDWSLKYGSVFKFNLFGRRVVAVSGYEALREMLVTRAQDFGGRPEEISGRHGRGIINTDMCPYLRQARKEVHGVLKMYGTGLHRFNERVAEVLDGLFEVFDSTKQETFDCYDALHDTLAAFVCTLIAGRRIDRKDPCVLMTKLIDIRARKMPASQLIFRALPFLTKILKSRLASQSQSQYAVFWNDFILPTKNTDEFKMGQGLLAQLCLLQQTEEQMQGNDTRSSAKEEALTDISDEDINMIINNIVLAGVVTSTSSLYALLNIFLHHPDVQDKIAEEVHGKVDRNERVTMAHKADLPYTRAVVLELLRYTSIVPHAIPHKTLANTQVQGYQIPKGTMVVACLYAHHRNSKEWEEPYSFRPNRFLDEDGSLLPADHPVRKRLLSFGAGARVCLGEALALNRLFIFTATIVQKFRILPPDDGQLISCDPRDWKFSPAFDPNRYRLRVAPRE